MMLILGVGNELRGDDAFGPLVVEKLRGCTRATLWSGDTPENFIGKIKEKVETLIIMDTTYLGKEPGAIEILDPDRIKKGGNTHKIPLSLIIDQLKPEKTYFIAAQPKAVEFGDEPSKEIIKAVEKAKEMVLEIIQ